MKYKVNNLGLGVNKGLKMVVVAGDQAKNHRLNATGN